MKFYKNSNNEVYAFEDNGSQDHLISSDLKRINLDEVHKLTKNKVTWEDIRRVRNQMLNDSDWCDLPNSPIKNKNEWLTYRQILRNIPQNYTSPGSVIWPQKPL